MWLLLYTTCLFKYERESCAYRADRRGREEWRGVDGSATGMSPIVKAVKALLLSSQRGDKDNVCGSGGESNEFG